MNLINFDNGFRHFQKEVKNKELIGCVNDKCYLNNKRYGTLLVNDKDGDEKKLSVYFYAFKRDFYRKFGEEFKANGECGLGESINTDILKDMFRLVNEGLYERIRMFFGYPNGSVYWISPQYIMREGYKRSTIAEGKSVYSFSIKHLTRYNPEEENELVNETNNFMVVK